VFNQTVIGGKYIVSLCRIINEWNLLNNAKTHISFLLWIYN
jgi:hypothetical protein